MLGQHKDKTDEFSKERNDKMIKNGKKLSDDDLENVSGGGHMDFIQDEFKKEISTYDFIIGK